MPEPSGHVQLLLAQRCQAVAWALSSTQAARTPSQGSSAWPQPTWSCPVLPAVSTMKTVFPARLCAMLWGRAGHSGPNCTPCLPGLPTRTACLAGHCRLPRGACFLLGLALAQIWPQTLASDLAFTCTCMSITCSLGLHVVSFLPATLDSEK